jgi:hypothetical protein
MGTSKVAAIVAAAWLLLRLAVFAVAVEPAAEHSAFSSADYRRHIEQLRPKIPKGFTVLVARPFVVIGDESPATVQRRVDHTVTWAVTLLKRAYFTKDPQQILDIWLFKDKQSYEENCKRLFHKTPDTPFGYFSSEDRALVMNISTGGGTLVHEIVHPFVAANFPTCPAWFNEGLGSLYEKSDEENGEIRGYPNWRLPGLQEAIRKHHVSTFEMLCKTTETEFYEKDPGTHYSQARYLCYYLQQKDLLRTFYRRFHDDCRQDPSGYETLKKILGRDDMALFQREWETYVLKLQYRR